MKHNPNEFVAGDRAVLDTNAEVIIHELTETGVLATIGRPGAPEIEWWTVPTRRLSPLKNSIKQ